MRALFALTFCLSLKTDVRAVIHICVSALESAGNYVKRVQKEAVSAETTRQNVSKFQKACRYLD